MTPPATLRVLLAEDEPLATRHESSVAHPARPRCESSASEPLTTAQFHQGRRAVALHAHRERRQ